MASTAEPAPPRLKVRLVLDGQGWILGKFANRLQENLGAWGVDASIAQAPSPDVDVNHWMFYGYAWSHFFQEVRRKLTPSTVMITHVDDPIKEKMLKEVLAEVADVGICMSRMTLEQLAGHGIARDRLCFISPAHDGVVSPRRLVIGITSRVYTDGRKREGLLVKLAEAMRLDLFHFEIHGSGWEAVIPSLEKAGATVRYFPGTDDYQHDYTLMMASLPTFDYYLYMGLDEGSMGLLDALAAGAGTIVTRQGFHLDIDGGITHGFWEGDEMIDVFRRIAEERQRRLDVVKHLTWNEYARRHAVVWRSLIAGEQHRIAKLLQSPDTPFLRPRRGAARLRDAIAYYASARRSDFLPLYFARRKWQIRAVLSKIKQSLLARLARGKSGRTVG